MDNKTNLKYYADSYAMETFNDMRNAQPAKDKLTYFNYVLEGTTETNALLLQKLYRDILSRNNIDYDMIPNSKGNLTGYKNYPLMSQSMEMLNTLYKGKNSEEIGIMNRLHDMIIACRKDFEFGFTFNIDVIMIYYNISVVALYDMIRLNIYAYAKKIKDNMGIDVFGKKKKADEILTVKNVKALLSGYEKGHWAKLVSTFKPKENLPRKTVESMVATEGTFDTVTAMVSSWYNRIPALLRMPITIVAGIIGIVLALRSLIAFFFNASVSIKKYHEEQKEFLEFAIEQEKRAGATDPEYLKKLEKKKMKAQAMIDTIQYKILKAEKKTKDDLKDMNTNYKKEHFDNVNSFKNAIQTPQSSSGFEF